MEVSDAGGADLWRSKQLYLSFTDGLSYFDPSSRTNRFDFGISASQRFRGCTIAPLVLEDDIPHDRGCRGRLGQSNSHSGCQMRPIALGMSAVSRRTL
jgi:hypothetical protein